MKSNLYYTVKVFQKWYGNNEKNIAKLHEQEYNTLQFYKGLSIPVSLIFS